MVRPVVQRTVGRWSAAWDALVAAHRPSPFLTSTWIDAVADDATFVVLAVDRSGRLLGGFPFELDHRGPTVRVSGSHLAPDHLDLVCADGDAPAVATVVAEWFRRDDLRRFDLHGLVHDSRLARVVPGAEDGLESVAPFATLPSRFDDYWSDRPGQLRSTVRRAAARLAKAGVGHERVPPSDADALLADFLDLHGARFSHQSALLPVRATFERAVRAALADGLMVGHRMTDGNRPVAVDLWFEFAGVASFYQSGRDPDPAWRGAGTTLKFHAIADAMARGCREIDLLRGDEPYKRDWAGDCREVRRVRTPPGLTERARHAARRRLGPIRRRLHPHRLAGPPP